MTERHDEQTDKNIERRQKQRHRTDYRPYPENTAFNGSIAPLTEQPAPIEYQMQKQITSTDLPEAPRHLLFRERHLRE